MPELLLAKPAALPSPAVSAAPNPATANANRGSKPAEAGRPAEQPFAKELHKQMSKSEEAKADPADAQAVADAAAETASSTAESAPEATLLDVLAQDDAVSPFIAQLMAQVGQLQTDKEDSATEATLLTEGPALVTAAPVSAAVNASADNPLSKETTAAPSAEAVLDVGLQNLTQDTKPGNEAAITAEEGALDAAGKPATKAESDFGNLIQRASEQLAQGVHADHKTNASNGGESVSLRMEAPVGHKSWASELGDKLTWMSGVNKQQADLVLNPPQLGRVEISLTVTGDQASATFASPSASVRELLENSLPRLREIMAEAGINLGQAHVGSESANQFGNQDPRGTNPRTIGLNQTGTDANAQSAATATATRSLSGRGLVDTFA